MYNVQLRPLRPPGGVGGLAAVTSVACVPGEEPAVATYFPAYDANGNIVQYFNEAGEAVAGFEYDAFGNTVATSGSQVDAFAHRFSTKGFDAETGLYYYGYRFYSPELGRWVSRDPAQEECGFNLFAAFANDGIDLVDLWGEASIQTTYAQRITGPIEVADKKVITCPESGAVVGELTVTVGLDVDNTKIFPGANKLPASFLPVVRTPAFLSAYMKLEVKITNQNELDKCGSPCDSEHVDVAWVQRVKSRDTNNKLEYDNFRMERSPIGQWSRVVMNSPPWYGGRGTRELIDLPGTIIGGGSSDDNQLDYSFEDELHCTNLKKEASKYGPPDYKNKDSYQVLNISGKPTYLWSFRLSLERVSPIIRGRSSSMTYATRVGTLTYE